jgi:hypothetical protein
MVEVGKHSAALRAVGVSLVTAKGRYNGRWPKVNDLPGGSRQSAQFCRDANRAWKRNLVTQFYDGYLPRHLRDRLA